VILPSPPLACSWDYRHVSSQLLPFWIQLLQIFCRFLEIFIKSHPIHKYTISYFFFSTPHTFISFFLSYCTARSSMLWRKQVKRKDFLILFPILGGKQSFTI
jgi:hypothetical protein